MKGGKSHLRRKKPGRVTRLYDKKLPVHSTDKTRIKRLIPVSYTHLTLPTSDLV